MARSSSCSVGPEWRCPDANPLPTLSGGGERREVRHYFCRPAMPHFADDTSTLRCRQGLMRVG